MLKTIPPVSIIIPTLNEEKYLPVLLESLKHLNTPLDIIVVDGGSTDATVIVAKKFQLYFSGHSSLRIIEAPNRGIALQRNLGAQNAKHSIFMFCDSDVIAPDHDIFISFILKFIQKKSVASVPILIPIESGKRIAFMHKTLCYVQRYLLYFGRPFFGGGALMTTKEVFNKVGGFDTKILLGEDVDYSFKAIKYGPCHQIKIKWQVSARRFIKYGYWWMFKNPSHLIGLLVKGRIKNPENLFYPFGEYDK